jgi:hypothetical protein
VTARRVRNLATALPRRRREGDPMAAFDRLPAPLRRWLAGAALPWSAASAARAWRAALARAGGDAEAAAAALAALEARVITRDAAKVWGVAHPAAQSAPAPSDASAARA